MCVCRGGFGAILAKQVVRLYKLFYPGSQSDPVHCHLTDSSSETKKTDCPARSFKLPQKGRKTSQTQNASTRASYPYSRLTIYKDIILGMIAAAILMAKPLARSSRSRGISP